MDTIQFDWEKIEKVVLSVSPDKYEMLSTTQIKVIEEKISKGESPIIKQQQAGGTHMDFGAAINVFAELMLATTLIVAWYDFVKPAKEEMTYENFYRTMKQVPQIEDFLIALLTQELLRTLERVFDQIADMLMHL